MLQATSSELLQKTPRSSGAFFIAAATLFRKRYTRLSYYKNRTPVFAGSSLKNLIHTFRNTGNPYKYKMLLPPQDLISESLASMTQSVVVF